MKEELYLASGLKLEEVLGPLAKGSSQNHLESIPIDPEKTAQPLGHLGQISFLSQRLIQALLQQEVTI
jgi:hypothetical protein